MTYSQSACFWNKSNLLWFFSSTRETNNQQRLSIVSDLEIQHPLVVFLERYLLVVLSQSKRGQWVLAKVHISNSIGSIVVTAMRGLSSYRVSTICPMILFRISSCLPIFRIKSKQLSFTVNMKASKSTSS